jgi:hypothetical protein
VILAFSTSSPAASVALFRDGRLVEAMSAFAPMAAGGACLEMLASVLERHGISLQDVGLFVADIGPGSFTGVKVGVMIAKTLAYAAGAGAAGVSSFDLVSRSQTVAFPSRKGEWFLRRPGETPGIVRELPSGSLAGYGLDSGEPTYPSAALAAAPGVELAASRPETLVPAYLASPSISVPRVPYRLAGPPE